MANSKCTNKVQFAVFINLVIMFSVFGVVLYVIGGIMYKRENYAKAVYEQNSCQVISSSYYQSKCSGLRGSTYVCYKPVWVVGYSILQDGEDVRISASIEEGGYRGAGDAQNKLDEYQIGMSYSCWCNTVDPSQARWKEPNTFVGMMLLIFAGVASVVCLVGIFCSYRVRKKSRSG